MNDNYTLFDVLVLCGVTAILVVGLCASSVRSLAERVRELETCGETRELVTLSDGTSRCVRAR